MSGWLRRLLALIVVIAFVNGAGGIAFAFDADGCDDAPLADQAGHQQHHDDSNAPCLGCPCCAVVPYLPSAPMVMTLAQPIAHIAYSSDATPLIGRSIAPDPSPPRLIA